MENNKLLIGVQFVEANEHGSFIPTDIELYVVRDITLEQLIEGVEYGLERLIKRGGRDEKVYRHCRDIFLKCKDVKSSACDGSEIYENIILTGFIPGSADMYRVDDCRFTVTSKDMSKPICDLGFITSSRIIFDATGKHKPMGMLDVRNVVRAFNPETSSRFFFPEYNISTRLLYQFDTTPINVIAPTDPPQKNDRGLFSLLLPSILSIGMMVVIRVIMSSNGSSGMSMILMTVGMGLVGFITTTINWSRQKKEFAANLANWRKRYEDYVDTLMATIRKRQASDAAKMDELYPDMLTLINDNNKGVYAMNEHIYSRSVEDEDFLTFRLGNSSQIPSKFQIKGSEKEVIFSDTFFEILRDGSTGKDHLHILLEEDRDNFIEVENLSSLPVTMSKRFAYMDNAPLLYSLRDKRCLGIVDGYSSAPISRSPYFISRMIFELCYYHSPEDLQFVLFFRNETEWSNIEQVIQRYKFMPHFRELFSDKSQFIFDKESAHMAMNSMLNIMNNRRNNSGDAHHAKPHIVMIIFEEHGLKEHAFAEYLPQAPAPETEESNDLGLSFVYVVKHKEYLPAYCNDVVSLDGHEMLLTPRDNVRAHKSFTYSEWENAMFSYLHDNNFEDSSSVFLSYERKVSRALRFLSSVYYARIAQNGKVPSSVSMYEMLNLENMTVQQLIERNWGFRGDRMQPSITKSLSVPLGKTETGIACLDLHEKSDGPHMLVAGTTGSGKSETVISYLLGLCMQYRPDEVNMLLVDMKGGGFTKRIGHLPHVVGSVTDVDGDENGTSPEYMLGRFLNAMKSEIKRRKLLFNKLHVDSIDKYIEACANIEAHIEKKKITGEEADQIRTSARDDKLSHLILVVDEFTELKRFTSENSDMDFMGEITTIARVGRSLGFHIILISQNIEGAITDDIRVNSKARLCLKVATRQASKDMIGTDLAASPFMPGNGRAYLLVGTGSKFEYFQSAYSGAGIEEQIPIEITLASKTGAYGRFYRSDKDNPKLNAKLDALKKSGQDKSQLEVICDAICQVYGSRREEISKPHIVFSAPLMNHIAWDREHDAVIEVKMRKRVTK